MPSRALVSLAAALAGLVACRSREAPPSAPPPPAPPAPRYDALPRPDFNRWATRTNTPVFWIADRDGDGAIDPDEVAALRFFPTTGVWVDGGRFTPAFEAAYAAIARAAKAPPPDPSTDEGKRLALVGQDLDQGRSTLVFSDLTGLSPDDKAFVGHMLTLGDLVDDLYELQNGASALAARVAPDAASQSLFRRNRGPLCVGPATEKQPLCSAVPGAPRPVFDLYPAELQADPGFCARLAARRDAGALLEDHFAVVRGAGADLKAVPYPEAYPAQMAAIARELGAAADAMKDPAEQALVTYLRAAATSFASNDWVPADEAWARMSVDNSKWYVRIAPDEVYWEPCAQKAGIHLAFARVNQASRGWQSKLAPVQQDLEAAIAARAGAPYRSRKVTFHIPDFIDIVINAGDDRDGLGGTIGQSLPNWGPVVNEGRGRTVAMTNLNTDPDSMAARRAQAESVFDATSMKPYAGTPAAGLLNTILHEVVHNLGPAHEYRVKGKTDDQLFGGPIASVMEELKAQTGGVFLIDVLHGKGLLSDAEAAEAYIDALVWAFGQASQGMYSGAGDRKTYSQLGAIQVGFLIDQGALVWRPETRAANGTDAGAFVVDPARLVPAFAAMSTVVLGIKARGDRKAAEALLARYVDSSAVVPHALIAERFLRHPKVSWVYSVAL